MTDQRDGNQLRGDMLHARFDDDLGQVVAAGLPTGAAGGVEISPAPGVTCTFDALTGAFSELVVDPAAGDNDGRSDSRRRDVLTWLFDTETTQAISDLAHRGEGLDVSIAPAHQALLHRLALLEDAEDTDPLVPDSPLWGTEEVFLAHRGKLGALAELHAVRTASRLAGLIEQRPDLLDVALGAEHVQDAAMLVANLVERHDPEAAEALRAGYSPAVEEHLEASVDEDRWLPALSGVLAGGVADGLAVPPQLDLLLLPEHTFRLGELPSADLVVHGNSAELLVTAGLDRRARKSVVESCWARLVDPETKTVLDAAPFYLDRTDQGRPTAATARLRINDADIDFHRTALEVVADRDRPVQSRALRHARRALRLANAALRAERRPHALHPGWDETGWSQHARNLWMRAGEQWSAADDTARAALAFARGAGLTLPPDLPQWAHALGTRAPTPQAPFLAEHLGV